MNPNDPMMKIEDQDLRSLYVIGDMQEPYLQEKIHSKPFSWFFTVIGVFLFVVGLIVYGFAAIILVVTGLREQFWEWGVLSLIVGLVIFWFSSQVRNKLGAKTFKNQREFLRINRWFGKNTVIAKPEVYSISVKSKSALLNFFSFGRSYQYVQITTHTGTYKLPLNQFNKADEMKNYFSELTDLLEDEYIFGFEKILSPIQLLLKNIWKDRSILIGTILLLIYVFFMIWGGTSMLLDDPNSITDQSLFMKNPDFLRLDSIYEEPSSNHLLGTDYLGRDIWARMIYGTVITLMVSLIAATVLILLIAFFGYTTAIFGGIWDGLIMRIGDTLLTFPPFIPIILLAMLSGPIRTDIIGGYYLVVFVGLAFITWPQGARVLRDESMKLLQEEYVNAARVLGASKVDIIRKHVIPKTFPTLVFLFTYALSDIILGMTMIGLIGLGAENTLTWGSDLEKAIVFGENVLNTWWTILAPTLWISGIILSLTLLSDAVRDKMQLSSSASQGAKQEEISA
jgi:ABC-type dipeptide/oligopeptide/nickel transport system permease subunit